MVVVWSARANRDLAEIWNYYGSKNLRAAVRIVRDIRMAALKLEKMPMMAPLELLLDDMPEGFRSVVVKKMHKIVYRIEGDTVGIVTIWDCRRDPVALREKVTERKS
jgi:plasmid stabilization system protein ParE